MTALLAGCHDINQAYNAAYGGGISEQFTHYFHSNNAFFTAVTTVEYIVYVEGPYKR